MNDSLVPHSSLPNQDPGPGPVPVSAPSPGNRILENGARMNTHDVELRNSELQRTKDFYKQHHDEILSKRFNSPFPIRRAVHREVYDTIVRLISPAETVLDDGCGEGTLSVLMAQKGACVVGLDFSMKNIEAARKYAAECGVQDQVHFLVGDSANLPFLPGAFETVVSNHVLEHLPDIDQGIDEVRRTMARRGLLAVPTCMSPYSWPLLGGDCYWSFSVRSPFALAFGFLRVLFALGAGREGVNEGYAGRKDLVHIFRFPWKFSARLRSRGLSVVRIRPQCLGVPYLLKPLKGPLAQRLGSYLGFGTIFEVR